MTAFEGPFLPYAHQTLDESDREAVFKAMKRDMITRGPLTQEFEKAFANEVGAQYAVSFSSGSAALYAAYQAAGVSSQDVAITTANTFIATAAKAVGLGALLRLVDIDRFGNMDIQEVEKELLKERSRGRFVILPVHFGGIPVDMQALDAVIQRPNVVIIEDAACALGSFYKDGKKVGSCAYSDMTTFSFHPAKNITTGEGGMVTTNDEALMMRLKKLRNSGKKPSDSPWDYEVDELSCNYHMTEMQAALGLSQLKKLETFQSQKQKLQKAYFKLLANVPGVHVEEADESRIHRALFPVYIEFQALGITRSHVMEELKKLGIQSQYHYIPLYKHPALFPFLSQREEEFVTMKAHFEKELSLPFFSSMQESDVYRVVTAIRKIIL